ncbi:organic cation/carnitine transporter 2-like isoform X2 [Mercenaria mercenaria]|uniref:organic cation/carnitine transporter 2-like isoform X2 n=1 Tax=Mercenaria mercenaria TaxID=6596 RepID=UPI00234F2D1C|nr:organic cation/carnitine transporter 2-like isoform X2 [Mercenaria mercenaria]
MESKTSPDQIIHELGGCGRYQIRMNVIVHLIKTIVCWSASSMVIISATPNWWCEDDVVLNELNMTACSSIENGSEVIMCPLKSCFAVNDTKCSDFAFASGMNTIVSEFELVCGKAYIPSTVMSLQVAGQLVGNIIAGQIADLIGRKYPLFASIAIILVFNLIGYFATNWIIFSIARFFIGFGSGFFLSTQYSLLSEFSLAKWRVWIIGFPSWPIEACLFALCAWLVPDWRYIHLIIAIMCVPCLLAWCVIPESFRWFIAHDKPDKAEEIIKQVAAYNKRELTDIAHHLEKPKDTKDRKYTFVDLLKSRKLIIITLLSALNWTGLGLVSYGIGFGVQALSGNLYFNFFLFSLVGIPSKAIALWLQNSYFYTDAPNKDALTNAFALVANIGVSTAWGPVQTMTIEVYPTVVRTIGFGSLSVMARVGAMIGPQLVYLNMYVAGLLYYVCGAVAVLCIIGSLGLPETMNSNLNDKITEENKNLTSEVNHKNVVV